jgi:PAS domain S-box-containing protein
VNRRKDPLADVAARIPGVIHAIVLDAERRPSIGSAAAGLEDLYGFPPDALARDAMPVFEHVALGDAERVFEGLQEAVRDGADWHEEFDYDHPGKGVRRIELRATAPVRHADGTVELAAHGLDVTDRRRQSAPMGGGGASPSALGEVLDAALEGFVMFDTRGKILALNDAFCALTGYGREELLRMDVAALEPETGPRELSERRTRVARDGAARFETRLQRHDGRAVEVEVSARYLAAEGGRFVAFARDVTRRRRAELEMAETEQRYRALMEGSSEAIFLLDADRQVLFWSPGAAQLLGWGLHEVVGRDLRDLALVSADDEEHFEEVLESVVGGTLDRVEVEASFRHKSGEMRRLSVTARNLLEDRAVRGLVLNARDVTELRAAEDALRRAARLESLGRLANGIAHDFNNLMTVILGGAESVRDCVARDQTPPTEDVDEIQAAAGRARTLTRQLLSFARDDAPNNTAVDLNDLLASSERLLRSVLGEHVELVLKTLPGLGMVACDPGRMEQVLLNLVVNARDAMPRGGTIVIRTSNVGRERVRLTIQDSGEGLSDEAKAHLFEPFYSTKAPAKGSGLGLANAYATVTQAGGTIRCESTRGRGTTFELEFPRREGLAAPVEPPARTVKAGTETILVVEDDPLVRGLIQRALRSAGYRALIAGSGKQALELSDREPGHVHLIISDVIMPGLLGPDLVARLRERRPNARVLFISGYQNDAIAARTVRDSGVDFLAKPFTTGALTAKIRTILDRP